MNKSVDTKSKLPRISVNVNFVGSKSNYRIPDRFYALLCDMLTSMEEHKDD